MSSQNYQAVSLFLFIKIKITKSKVEWNLLEGVVPIGQHRSIKSYRTCNSFVLCVLKIIIMCALFLSVYESRGEATLLSTLSDTQREKGRFPSSAAISSDLLLIPFT